MFKTSFIILAVCQLLSGCFGYSSGPPDSACESRMPEHRGNSPQTGECPYKIDAQSWMPGQVTNMTLRRVSGDGTFKGFLVSVEDPNGNLIGSMSSQRVEPENANVGAACGATSLSHTDNVPKDYVSLKWTAPSDLDVNVKVKIRLTVVEEFDKFYVDCNNFDLSADSNSLPITTTPRTSATSTTTITTTMTMTPRSTTGMTTTITTAAPRQTPIADNTELPTTTSRPRPVPQRLSTLIREIITTAEIPITMEEVPTTVPTLHETTPREITEIYEDEMSTGSPDMKQNTECMDSGNRYKIVPDTGCKEFYHFIHEVNEYTPTLKCPDTLVFDPVQCSCNWSYQSPSCMV